MGRALGTQTGTGTVGVQRQYHTDDQGNVLAISDDSQATAVSYDIGAFGNVRSGSATDQPLDFVGGQGYQRDADAGTVDGELVAGVGVSLEPQMNTDTGR